MRCFKSIVSVKTKGTIISENKEGESSLGTGILNVIKKIVKNKLAD